MEIYEPPFTISNLMLDKVAYIAEKLGKISNWQNLEAKPHLRRSNRIKSIYSSLRIEANSLPISAVSGIIDGKTVIGDANDIQEVKNAYSAYENISGVNPYDVRELCRLHGIMTKGLVKESGKFRHGNEGVFDDGKCIFVAPPPDMVPVLMYNLFKWMSNMQKKLHPLILSSIFHYEFVFIHPFADGNGRMARLWHTLLLARWKKIFLYIPLESQIEKFQAEYYEAISKCHKLGNSNYFIEFMLTRIAEIVEVVVKQLEINSGNEYVNKLLLVMECSVSYSVAELMSLLQLKSKSAFRKNYLVPALQDKKIQMTIPDKPNSRNQKYVKVSEKQCSL